MYIYRERVGGGKTVREIQSQREREREKYKDGQRE